MFNAEVMLPSVVIKYVERISFLNVFSKKQRYIIIYCQKLLEKDPKDKFALQNLSTAYNMIGSNKTNTNSLLYCFRLANKIIMNRSKIA